MAAAGILILEETKIDTTIVQAELYSEIVTEGINSLYARKDRRRIRISLGSSKWSRDDLVV